MIHVRLPHIVSLVCPACHERCELGAELLHNRDQLHCPVCGASSDIYGMLAGPLRRRLYHAVRDEMENRIYLAQEIAAGRLKPEKG